jgi:hypothetical protein
MNKVIYCKLANMSRKQAKTQEGRQLILHTLMEIYSTNDQILDHLDRFLDEQGVWDIDVREEWKSQIINAEFE